MTILLMPRICDFSSMAFSLSCSRRKRDHDASDSHYDQNLSILLTFGNWYRKMRITTKIMFLHFAINKTVDICLGAYNAFLV